MEFKNQTFTRRYIRFSFKSSQTCSVLINMAINATVDGVSTSSHWFNRCFVKSLVFDMILLYMQ